MNLETIIKKWPERTELCNKVNNLLVFLKTSGKKQLNVSQQQDLVENIKNSVIIRIIFALEGIIKSCRFVTIQLFTRWNRNIINIHKRIISQSVVKYL